MMNTTMRMTLAAGLLCGLSAIAAETPDWENLAVNSINRMPARTYSMPLASEQAAFTDAIEPTTPYKRLLNGTWRFSWAGDPALRVKDFWKTDFKDADWHTIDVPCCVETRGFGSPGYTNVRYPHAMAWPKILDRDSEEPNYNPVSSYRTWFQVPKEWDGRDVFIRFDGVYSAYYLWVNGQKVGYAEDSKLPSEFDITKYVKPGANLLAVEVYRWCDGSYLEDQDMFRFSGIYRDVTLWSRPKDGIWDFEVKTSLASDYASAKIALKGLDGDWSAKLYDAATNVVATLGAKSAEATVKNVALWSAEKPNLYTLVVRKGDDVRMRRVGFKEQKIVGHTILVNGKAIKFKGVNRHEVNPDNGRTVTMADMIRDVTLFKQYNINTVRTSHYPDHHLWYDLCDKYGIYVVAEANVEGHEPAYKEKGLGRFPEWEHAIVERNLRHVTFYRNHPSVTLWSMGNETGHGDCFRHAIRKVKALDPTRPVHWERGNVDADVDSTMYASVDWLDQRGQYGDGTFKGEFKQKGGTDDAKNSPNKAFFMCEYAHAMGNAIGNFQEYWDVFYKYESLSGGCIWDWIDQGLWKYTDKVDPATGRRERFLSYGGDWDEEPNDGPFCCNGVIDPLRRVTAKLVEVGHVHRNLVVTRKENGKLELWNRFGFTFADEFRGTWRLSADGRQVAGGDFAVPHLAPLSKTELDPATFVDAKALERVKGKELFLEIDFHLKEKTLWAGAGWPVARNQVAFGGAWDFAPKGAAGSSTVVVEQAWNGVVVKAGGTKAVFNRKSGTLSELVMNGRTVLKDPADGIAAGPQLTCMRAFVDNDKWIRDINWFGKEKGCFFSKGLTQLRYHARPIQVFTNGVRIVTDVTGSKSAGFEHEAVWTFADDGTITVANKVVPHGSMPQCLPRLGLSLKLDRALETVNYYGRGPEENYVDRLTGSFFGTWRTTVTRMYEEYVRPQDNGYRSDVRWVTFTDPQGKGVKFSASVPLFVQALHYGVEDLEFARHRKGQQRVRIPLVPREEVCLNLDVRQTGLGGCSCGPVPLEKYMVRPQTESWTLTIAPAR